MDKVYHPSGRMRFTAAMGILGCAIGISNAVPKRDYGWIAGVGALGLLCLLALVVELHKQYRVTDEGIEVRSFRSSVFVPWRKVTGLATSAGRRGTTVYVASREGVQAVLEIGQFSWEFAYILVSHCHPAIAPELLKRMARQYLKWNGLSDPAVTGPRPEVSLPKGRRADDDDHDVPVAPV